MEENLTLYSLSNLKCQCVLKDGIETLQNHLSKTKLSLENKNDRDIKKWMQNVDKALEILKRQEQEHYNYRVEFAKEFIAQKKLLDINSEKNNIQTVSYLSGKAKEEDTLLKEQTKKRKKKRKKTVK